MAKHRLEENYRETIQNAFLLNGYFVEMISYEKIIWSKTKQYRADFAIRTNALLDEGIDTWLFECKSYAAGISRGTIGKMNQLFTTKQYRADFAIRTNALLDEGIDTWLFECKSYAAGISRGTIGKMNQLFTMAYMESPREHGIKVSVVVNHVAMIEQAREYYAGCKIRDYFSFILIDPVNRCVKDEFCIPRIDGTEKSIFKQD